MPEGSRGECGRLQGSAAQKTPGTARSFCRLLVDVERRRLFGFGAVSLVLAGGYLLVVGLATAIIANPWFERMTPVTVWNLVFWIGPGLLVGLLGGSYVVPLTGQVCAVGERTAFGGVLSFLAAGCPLCNKAVVLVLGTSGALAYFEPLQPVLGLASVALLSYGVWLRLRPA